ncbi:MAG: hypothetical protein ACOX75_05270 [Lachnospiraceae bacterium]
MAALYSSCVAGKLSEITNEQFTGRILFRTSIQTNKENAATGAACKAAPASSQKL